MILTVLLPHPLFKAGKTEVSEVASVKEISHKQGQPRPEGFPGLGGQLGSAQSLLVHLNHREPGLGWWLSLFPTESVGLLRSHFLFIQLFLIFFQVFFLPGLSSVGVAP